ncbi:estradiol 17-beta-dehydrogenase 8 [Exaiptasia diaphana]|uniref:(3R)-3-hydroxyacyl-CoA dehydrogenase n=1 Tax=Exaiptasia diaphana TaxID=2652724 RepID=A0A913XP18_EXADI|nr:estradiol 17-beta-dehydrogenase 8 [Exaiptasia diaphana]KXJ10430.1 Estradiol 17-beta-dehydrogenase 8 [Exaiptasia diaphana]
MAATRGILSGRLALVTGGASGIGRAVCESFAKQGAIVAVVDKDINGAKETAESLQNNNQSHAFYSVDVSSSDEVGNLIKDVRAEHERAPCILVNSAGIIKDALFLKMKEDQFDDVIKVNLKGTFLMSQHVSKAMVEDKIVNGSIVNISSMSGKIGNVGQANYAASKTGVQGLTRTCARELARFGIRCNAVLPGFIDTPMTKQVPEELMNQVVGMIPLNRMGQPSEIADAVTFLASDLSSYITGISLDVNGGLAM